MNITKRSLTPGRHDPEGDQISCQRSIPFNIKVILDGEEEKGSKPLQGVVVQNKELLEADYLIIADGPAHRSGHLFKSKLK